MDFYLAQLDFGMTASSATLSGAAPVSFSGNATADVNVSLSSIRNLFNFQSDSTDLSSAVNTDIKYRVSYSSSGDFPLGIHPANNTLVTVNAIDPAANIYGVTHDYVRYLALRLFNTHLGVDLFANEGDLVGDLNTAFQVGFDTVLANLATSGVADSDGNSPAETILNNIIHSQQTRLSDLTQYAIDGEPGWYKMPVQVGDKLYFVVTISAAANQHTLTGVSPIPDRTYLMRLTVVADS
jgi:hypothetical protein